MANTQDPQFSQTSHSFLHAYCIRPNLHFDSQRSDEQVILVIRAHPITQIYWIINGFLLGFVIFVLNFFLPNYLNTIQIIFFDFFMIGFIFAYLWINFLKWFFNVGIITNERVVDEDFSGIIYKEVTEAPLNRIQDITEKTGGFLESFIDFGNVFIQTAGTEPNIEFIKVPKPSQVVRLINNLVHEIPI